MPEHFSFGESPKEMLSTYFIKPILSKDSLEQQKIQMLYKTSLMKITEELQITHETSFHSKRRKHTSLGTVFQP